MTLVLAGVEKQLLDLAEDMECSCFGFLEVPAAQVGSAAMERLKMLSGFRWRSDIVLVFAL